MQQYDNVSLYSNVFRLRFYALCNLYNSVFLNLNFIHVLTITLLINQKFDFLKVLFVILVESLCILTYIKMHIFGLVFILYFLKLWAG